MTEWSLINIKYIILFLIHIINTIFHFFIFTNISFIIIIFISFKQLNKFTFASGANTFMFFGLVTESYSAGTEIKC